MALDESVQPKIDARRYGQLPAGVSRWSLNPPAILGTTTGITTLSVQFNPNSNEDFQKYVSMTRLVIKSDIAALVILGVELSLEGNQWEDTGVGITIPLDTFQMETTFQAANYMGKLEQPLYFGRAVKGAAAIMNIRLQEINTTRYLFWATGLMSDSPFIVPDYLRP